MSGYKFQTSQTTLLLFFLPDAQFYTVPEERLSLSPNKKRGSKASPQRALSLPASHVFPPQDAETVEEKVERARSKEDDSLPTHEPKDVQEHKSFAEARRLESLGEYPANEDNVSDISVTRLGSQPLLEVTRMLSKLAGSLHRIQSNKELERARTEAEEPVVEEHPLIGVKRALSSLSDFLSLQKIEAEPLERLYRVVSQLFQLYSLKFTRSAPDIRKQDASRAPDDSMEKLQVAETELKDTQAPVDNSRTELRNELHRLTSDVIQSCDAAEGPAHDATRDQLHRILRRLEGENVHLRESEVLLDVMQCLVDHLMALTTQEQSERNPQEQQPAVQETETQTSVNVDVSKSLQKALHNVADQLTNMANHMQKESSSQNENNVISHEEIEKCSVKSDRDIPDDSSQPMRQSSSGLSTGSGARPKVFSTAKDKPVSEARQRRRKQLEYFSDISHTRNQSKDSRRTKSELPERPTRGNKVDPPALPVLKRPESSVRSPEEKQTVSETDTGTAGHHQNNAPRTAEQENTKQKSAKLNRLGELFAIVSEIKQECLDVSQMKTSTRDVQTATSDMEVTRNGCEETKNDTSDASVNKDLSSPKQNNTSGQSDEQLSAENIATSHSTGGAEQKPAQRPEGDHTTLVPQAPASLQQVEDSGWCLRIVTFEKFN